MHASLLLLMSAAANCIVQVIRELLGREGEGHQQRYVIVVEHDLSVLDYLSDFICCLYGKPGAYGVVTLPFSVREGINIFLAGGLVGTDTALHAHDYWGSGSTVSVQCKDSCHRSTCLVTMYPPPPAQGVGHDLSGT